MSKSTCKFDAVINGNIPCTIEVAHKDALSFPQCLRDPNKKKSWFSKIGNISDYFDKGGNLLPDHKHLSQCEIIIDLGTLKSQREE